MRARDLFGHTLREAPAEAESASHRLLVRGAFIRRVAAGIYAWLPLGLRVLRRIEDIVRTELDRAGASEVLMPALMPRDLLDATGRWESFGVELYRFSDPGDREWFLGPTHEECVTFLASTELPSYRDLPSVPYQVQWKYRYAPRPRGGLLRGREFLMTDAYSFDADQEGLKASYHRMAEAFEAVFERCGVTALMVEAQAGVIGGSVNHEFVQPSDAGEDTFARCDGCGYAANTETASGEAPLGYDFGEAEVETVHTPGMVSVSDVAGFLGVDERRLAKAMLYRAGDELVCALVPGDRELNEYKLSRAVGGAEVRMLEDFSEAGLVKGFTGPVGLSGVRLIADRSLEEGRNLVTGANQPDHHLTGVSAGRDFVPDSWVDLVAVEDGDRCLRCEGALRLRRGIEIGHVFQLGTKYSEAMGARFADETGTRRPYVMGCYGLGVSRLMASVVEEHHDDRGIIWPRAVAPFQVAILVLTEAAREGAESLYVALSGAGVDVVIDDREGLSAGARFADADLIGCPVQVVAGKTYLANGSFEAKVRSTGERFSVTDVGDVVALLERCP